MRQFLLATTLFFLFTNSTSAANGVIWFKPRLKASLLPRSYTVVFEGRTTPNTEIRVDSEKIIFVKGFNKLTPMTQLDLPASIVEYWRATKNAVEARVVTTKSCELKQGTSDSGKALLKIKTGNYLKVIKKLNSGWTVKGGNKEGFISANCAKPAEESFTQELFSEISTRSDKIGFFKLSLSLPFGLLQVPIIFSGAENKETLLLSASIEPKKIQLNVRTSPRPSADLIAEELKEFETYGADNSSDMLTPYGSISLSAFGGQRTYKQGTSSSDFEFSNSSGPGLAMDIVARSRRWGGQLHYELFPGKLASSSSLTLDKKTYSETMIMALAEYQSVRRENSFLFGVASHELPFLGSPTPSEVQLLSYSQHSMALGFLTYFFRKNASELSLQGVFTYPLSGTKLTSGDLKQKSGYTGSLNIKYARRWSDNFYYSGSLEYRMQNEEFQYTNPNGNIQYSNKQSLVKTLGFIGIGYLF